MNSEVVLNSAVVVTPAASGIALPGSAKLYLDLGRPIVIRKIKPGKKRSACTAERRESLLNCLNATWEAVSMPHFRTGYFTTPAIRRAEKRIEQIQAKVLEGKAPLSNFREAVKRWELAVISAVSRGFQETIDCVAGSTKVNSGGE